MDSEAQRIEGLIREEFGPAIQHDLLRHLWKGYEGAWEISREFDPPQMRKEYGHLRLSFIEQSFKLLCQKHKELSFEDVRHNRGSYSFFTMTTKTLLVTCSAVPSETDLPRKSDFRESLASGMNYHLFEDVEAVEGRKFFHVLLLHNAERRVEFDREAGKVRRIILRDRPGFAILAVPERGGTECIWRKPLFDDHADVVLQLRGLSVEDVTETRIPTRKRRPDTNEDTDRSA